MRVVADSHAIYWFLISPERLSDTALEALSQAEEADGIVVSALTMPDMWMAVTRKRGQCSDRQRSPGRTPPPAS